MMFRSRSGHVPPHGHTPARRDFALAAEYLPPALRPGLLIFFCILVTVVLGVVTTLLIRDVITQETTLFLTLEENLRYAKRDATQQEIGEVCRLTQINDAIMKFPDGYSTLVGKRGYRLSGGGKQRIAIGRALLRNPRVLIMDEAISALDSRSEALMQAALAQLLRGSGGLVIAHRLSTILTADTILLMDRGRIVQRGARTQLLREGGLYAVLYREQLVEKTRSQGAAGAVGTLQKEVLP